MGEPAQPTPAERRAGRELAAAFVAAVTEDLDMPAPFTLGADDLRLMLDDHGIEALTAQREAEVTAVFGLAQEICMLLASAAEPLYERPRARPSRPDRIRVDRGDFDRVGGDVECSVCGCAYHDHPVVVGYEFLKRTCAGRLIKT